MSVKVARFVSDGSLKCIGEFIESDTGPELRFKDNGDVQTSGEFIETDDGLTRVGASGDVVTYALDEVEALS